MQRVLAKLTISAKRIVACVEKREFVLIQQFVVLQVGEGPCTRRDLCDASKGIVTQRIGVVWHRGRPAMLRFSGIAKWRVIDHDCDVLQPLRSA